MIRYFLLGLILSLLLSAAFAGLPYFKDKYQLISIIFITPSLIVYIITATISFALWKIRDGKGLYFLRLFPTVSVFCFWTYGTLIHDTIVSKPNFDGFIVVAIPWGITSLFLLLMRKHIDNTFSSK